MKSLFKSCVSLSSVSVLLFAAFAFAQAPVPVAQPAAVPAPAPAVVPAPVPAEVPAPAAVVADSATHEAEPVVIMENPEPAPVVNPEPVPEPVVQQVQAVVAETPVASEPLDIKFHFGVRSAFGISAMRGHKAMQSADFRGYAIKLGPALSGSLGLAFALEINSLFTVAPELQYTLYRSNGRYIKKQDGMFGQRNEAGIVMHSLELPILARFSFDNIYAEVGPQIGFNRNAEVYINSELKSPNDMNLFAFGPSAGAGIKIGDILLGVRGYFGILEYAENTNGYPWAAQVSLTKFFF